MEEKRGRNRRAHLDQIVKDENGKYVYKGTLYHLEETPENRRRAIGKLWALCGAAACGIVICGCIPVPGMNRSIYLLIPYMIELVAAIYLCWKLGRLTLGGADLREYVYQDLAEKIPMSAVITGAGAGFAFAGEIVYLILNGFSGSIGFIVLFLFLQALACAAAFAAKKNFSQLKWFKKKSDTKENSDTK
ncbi:MAG: hypothetical protein Q4F41_17785 [Eubacteriales bacterium]|nr:hypothetical protein [Eubacteriales bacterium]